MSIPKPQKYNSSKVKKRLRNKADKLWYEKCKKGKCEVCGNTATQVHHYFYKSSYGHMRYDEDNGVSLCTSCHFLLHHQDPHRIEDKIIAVRGQKWLDKLKKKAYAKPKAGYQTIGYYKGVIEELENLN